MIEFILVVMVLIVISEIRETAFCCRKPKKKAMYKTPPSVGHGCTSAEPDEANIIIVDKYGKN